MSKASHAVMFALKQVSAMATNMEPASTVAASQTGATPIRGRVAKVKKAAATGSFLLPSVASEEAQPVCFVVNEAGVTINVYPSVGEKQNGTLNQVLQLTDGQVGVFFPCSNADIPIGGTAGPDWVSAAIG